MTRRWQKQHFRRRRHLIEALESRRLLASVQMPQAFDDGNAPYRQEAMHLMTGAHLGSSPGGPVVLQTDANAELFESPVALGEYGRGDNPKTTKLGDFNSDDLPDLVTLTNDSLVTRLGVGQNQFAPRVFTNLDFEDALFDSCASTNDFGLGDMDEDGIPDAVIECSGELYVVQGEENGSFDARLEKVPTQTFNINNTILADFNRDNHLDVVLTTFDTLSDARILLGDGTGKLSEPASVFDADALVSQLTVADFDDDQNLDIAYQLSNPFEATVDYEQSLWVQKGNGDGTFQALSPLVPYNSQRSFGSLVAADMNADGMTDLVLSNYEMEVNIWYQTENGYQLRSLPLPDYVLSANVIDLPGESKPAIVAKMQLTDRLPESSIVILTESTDYDYEPAISPGVYGNDSLIEVVDFNGDEFPDLMHGVNPASFFAAGNATGFDAEVPIVPFSESPEPLLHASGDFNEDGVDDIVSTHRWNDHVTLLFGSENVRSSEYAALQIVDLGAVYDVNGIHVADADSDGHLDLLLTDESTVLWLRGLGDGTFDVAETAGVDGSIGQQDLAFGDLDGSGIKKVGVIATASTTAMLYTWEVDSSNFAASSQFNVPGLVDQADFYSANGSVEILVAKSQGTVRKVGFSESGELDQVTSLATLTVSQEMVDFKAAKLNDDDVPDFYVGYDTNSSFHPPEAHRSNGSAGYDTFTVPTIPGFSVIRVVDLNRDGIDEIVSQGQFSATTINYLLADSLQATEIDRAEQITHVDFDGDGTLDQVYWRSFTGDLQFQRGKANVDGSSFHSEIYPGIFSSVTLDLQALDGRDSYAHVWIDSDQDGVWSQSEKVVDGAMLENRLGAQSIEFLVPASAELGNTFARVRIADSADLGPDGLALSGEVEDHTILIVQIPSFDFGDAPTAEQSGFLSSYPVTLAQDGARHGFAESGLWLGDSVVSTSDGIPSSTADHEETMTNDPGYAISDTVLLPGELGTLELEIKQLIPNQPVHVSAWLDQNRDGDWDDAGEFVINESRVPESTVEEFQFFVSELLAGQTSYMRVRIASLAVDSPTGLAFDGEVVDFAVHVGDESEPRLAAPRPVIGGVTRELAVSETGSVSDFTVHLNRRPDSVVEVDLISADESRVVPSPAMLQFDATNWMTPQVVTVTGVSDGTANSAESVRVFAQSRIVPPDGEPEQLRAVALGDMPHDTEAFTQGLLWHDGKLYESTGLYGSSSLREVDPATGEVLRQVDVPSQYFAEGLARVDDRLIQLTWKSGVAFEYGIDDFSQTNTFNYSGEGWGLCYDGQRLIRSDGTDVLYFHDPETFELLGQLSITNAGQPQGNLNELECVDGHVYANVWLADTIVQIDPETGTVVAEIDASGLLTAEEAQAANVLNGIAVDSDTGRLLLTGKNWPKLFEVGIVPVIPSGIDSIAVTTVDKPPIHVGEYLVTLDKNETISAGPDWSLGETYVADGQVIRQVKRDRLTVKIAGETAWQNALQPSDVDQSGDATTLDALVIINALVRIDGGSTTVELRLPTPEELAEFFFLDVTGDGYLSSLDALLVINGLVQEETTGESQLVKLQISLFEHQDDDEHEFRDSLIASLF